MRGAVWLALAAVLSTGCTLEYQVANRDAALTPADADRDAQPRDAQPLVRDAWAPGPMDAGAQEAGG